MELTRQSRRRLQVAKIAIPIQLPLYLRLMLGLSLGVLVVVSGVTTLTRLVQPPANPFSAYTDLLPGQVTADLQSHGFACIEQTLSGPGPYPPTSTIYCDYRPSAGKFEHIGVYLSADHIVRMVTFTVRQENLKYGDLVLLWGRPPIMTSAGEKIAFYWSNSEWSAVAYTKRGRCSYLMPLNQVIFVAAS